MLNVGVIGTSWWADLAHLPGLQSVEGLTVKAICGRDQERLREIADKFNISTRYTDYHDLLKSDEIEAVST